MRQIQAKFQLWEGGVCIQYLSCKRALVCLQEDGVYRWHPRVSISHHGLHNVVLRSTYVYTLVSISHPYNFDCSGTVSHREPHVEQRLYVNCKNLLAINVPDDLKGG